MTGTGPDPSAQDHGGLNRAFSRVAGSLLALVVTRGKLAGLELAEERERLTRRLALLLLGSLLLAQAALFAGFFVIALFWDTHRLTAILLTAGAYVLVGGFLLWRAISAGRGAPFMAATLAELERDHSWLERRVALRDETPGA